MLVLLALAVGNKTPLDALADATTRRRLRALARASPRAVGPFLRAVLSAEPWLALNALGDGVLLPWHAELRALMREPAARDVLGQLPVRPVAALARLRRPSLGLTRQGPAVRQLALCWARKGLPPELLECVAGFCTRGRIWRAAAKT